MGESINKRHKQIDIKIILKKENLVEEANNKYDRKSRTKKRKQRKREREKERERERERDESPEQPPAQNKNNNKTKQNSAKKIMFPRSHGYLYFFFYKMRKLQRELLLCKGRCYWERVWGT
jgi:hypothetical protein